MTGLGIEAELTLLFIAHFVGDFMLQEDDIARNKSKSNAALSVHVLETMLAFAVLLAVMVALGLIHQWLMLAFVLANGAAHWLTDWATSRLAARAYAQERRHEFFVIIGFDQLLHVLTLVWLWKLLVTG